MAGPLEMLRKAYIGSLPDLPPSPNLGSFQSGIDPALDRVYPRISSEFSPEDRKVGFSTKYDGFPWQDSPARVDKQTNTVNFNPQVAPLLSEDEYGRVLFHELRHLRQPSGMTRVDEETDAEQVANQASKNTGLTSSTSEILKRLHANHSGPIQGLRNSLSR